MPLGFFDGDDAVLADLVHRFGDDPRRCLVVVGGDGPDLRDHVATHRLGLGLERGDDGVDRLVDAALEATGLAPAATLRTPSRKMAWASTVAVVVPSPAMSEVLLATSLTICAPMFSSGSRSSISFATDTPSLVMVGEP